MFKIAETPPRANPEVLIVGAGPSGLALASFLAVQGIPLRIIDKNTARSDKSKALGVQAGTLESLDAEFGGTLSKEMISCGHPTREMWAHFDEQDPIRVDLSSIPSAYDYILILEQSETERILEKFLNSRGVLVERETELTSFEQEGEKLRSRIQTSRGTEELDSRFLVGCDGAHSTVRHSLGIPFLGKAYEGDFILGDVRIDWPWKHGTVRDFMSDRGVMICFPMKGERRYRLVLVPKTKQVSETNSIELEEFRKIASSLCPKELRIDEPTWLTHFRIQQRIAETYRKGNAFLVGDAAHIHNPAGGQGMNTGIQDALNLGDKLSRVLRGAAPALLDRYEAQRRPVARAVLKGTDSVFRLALIRGNPALMGFLRRRLMPKLLGTRWIQRKVLASISEVRIARQEISARAQDRPSPSLQEPIRK